MDTSISTARTQRTPLATAALMTGVIAGALTTVLSFLALALSAVAVGTGIAAVRRGQEPTRAAVGITAAAVSTWVIVLEIFVLGG